MDYKYIEKLLERFWKCETSLEEESVLRAFFRQKDIPQSLEPYRSLFAYEDQASEIKLGADFDDKVLKLVEQPSVSARRIPFTIRLRPLFKAAAAVAIVLTLGNAAQRSFRNASCSAPDYNYSTYEDTYEDPQVAYDEVSAAFRNMSDGLREKHKCDSLGISVKEKRVQ